MDMGKKTALIFFFLPALLAGALAAEGTLYNFGTMQQGSSFSAEPGDSVNLSVFFFQDEQYGNRITHLKVFVEGAPPGWQIDISPPESDVELNVSGVITTSRENLYVEPRPVLPVVPAQAEQGYSYLFSPSGKGYLQAKQVVATVKIPKNAELGKTYNVKLAAEAFWFGQGGNIALKQSRPFAFTISTAKKEYTETILPKAKPAANESGQPQEASPLDGSLLTYGLGAAVVVLLLYVVFTRKGKKPAKKAS